MDAAHCRRQNPPRKPPIPLFQNAVHRRESEMHRSDFRGGLPRLCRGGAALALARTRSVPCWDTSPRTRRVRSQSVFWLKWVRAELYTATRREPTSRFCWFSLFAAKENQWYSAIPRASRAWRVRFEPKIFWREDFLEGRTKPMCAYPTRPCARTFAPRSSLMLKLDTLTWAWS